MYQTFQFNIDGVNLKEIVERRFDWETETAQSQNQTPLNTDNPIPKPAVKLSGKQSDDKKFE